MNILQKMMLAHGAYYFSQSVLNLACCVMGQFAVYDSYSGFFFVVRTRGGCWVDGIWGE